MDESGIPDLGELYRGLHINTLDNGANKHLKLAFPARRIWMQLQDRQLNKRRAKKKKCNKRDHAACTRNECRNGYELTQVDVIDVLVIHVGLNSIGNSEGGFDESKIANVPAFNRFIAAMGDKLEL